MSEYEYISEIEGALPYNLKYDGQEQRGSFTLHLNPENVELTLSTNSYFTRKEVIELAMILLRYSNQMQDFSPHLF